MNSSGTLSLHTARAYVSTADTEALANDGVSAAGAAAAPLCASAAAGLGVAVTGTGGGARFGLTLRGRGGGDALYNQSNMSTGERVKL